MISRFLPHPVRRLLGVKTAGRPPSYVLIDQPGGLAPLLAAIEKVDEVALDTEADNMFHYRVRVCLLQFLVGDEVFLVDVIAPIDLNPLWKLLEKKHLVMHGSDFDLRLLHDLCGFRAKSIFDTMLAAQLLGRQRIGLASLLEDHFGVQLDKNGQKANWSRRPLLPKLLDYASLDVWHLPELRDLLEKELTKLGRMDWLDQQCRAQIQAGTEGFTPPGDNDWRVGKSERLRGKGLTVLHAVWHWREQQAQRLDTPPFKVCSTDLLLKISFTAETTETPEAILHGVHLGKRQERLFSSLAAAVRTGLERDPKTLPRRPGRDPNHSALSQAEIALLERIKVDRDRVAGGLKIEPTLIANRSQLSQIVQGYLAARFDSPSVAGRSPPRPALAESAVNANIARHLGAMAAAQPLAPALKVPRGRTSSGDIDYLSLSFRDLDAEVASWVGLLEASGVRRGDRTLVMVRQGLPLIASVFALFRIGAVPVVIDPGMGLGNFLRCVDRTLPRALVGIPFAQIVSRVFPGAFKSVAVRVKAQSSLTARLGPAAPTSATSAQNEAEDLAAILFTSGSTGTPKGVCYEHGMFEAQVRMIREAYGIEPGEVDLPMLPIFALFNPALGMTTVVPEIDPRRPAQADPAKIVQAILQEKVTNSFGSPTLWRKISDHCVGRGVALPSLKRVLCAGAPVPSSLWESSGRFLTHGTLHSPYGATEALPVSTISALERAAAGRGTGACVGRPLPETQVRIIEIEEGPISHLSQTRDVAPGSIGEIIVRGPAVTKEYDRSPEANAQAKIADPDGGIWHRLGDCGILDTSGRLWFCGRKVERVQTGSATLYTEPCEQVFRVHPNVGRCALVGIGPKGTQVPAIVVEGAFGQAEREKMAAELLVLARSSAETAGISRFYFHPKFPVDVRHNAKIHRLTLAKWAAGANPVIPS